MSSITPFSFIFFKGKNPISRLIRYFTDGRYSHTAMFIDSIHVVETDWWFPVKIRHTKYSTNDYDLYKLNFELTDEQEDTVIKFIHSELNRKYDWKFLWSRLGFILFGIKPKQSNDKYTCDELLYEAFLTIGIELIDNKDNLTPESLSRSKWLYKVKPKGELT